MALTKDHAISGTLILLQELLQDEAFQYLGIASDESAQFDRDKIHNIAESLQSLVANSSRTLVSENVLNRLDANLQSPINELTAFVANRNPGHLASAVSQLDQSILGCTWAFQPRSRLTIARIDGQRAQLASVIAQLAETLKAQASRLNELKEAQAQLKNEAASLLNLEKSFNKAQLERHTDFSTLISESEE